MKLIDPSVTLIQQPSGITGIYKQIEIAARNCYKSEDNITEHSYEKMYNMLRKKGHLAMLEHGTVYLTLKWWHIVKFFKYLFNPYSKVHRFKYVTTNLRVLTEHNWIGDLLFLSKIPTKYHEQRITLKFNTNIGVTREGNRHRTFSIAEQSTRFCNYTDKNKFGKDIIFIKPSWYDQSTDEQKQRFEYALRVVESAYKYLIEKQWVPQQAREVLSLATKSEIIYTAFTSDWKHWFDLRLFGVTGKPHPNMEQIARLAKEELQKYGLWDLIYGSNKEE